ncbi:MAG: response regulator [Myxococcota bacterium]|nr:response regulator [Myxococcota bacterium]
MPLRLPGPLQRWLLPEDPTQSRTPRSQALAWHSVLVGLISLGAGGWLAVQGTILTTIPGVALSASIAALALNRGHRVRAGERTLVLGSVVPLIVAAASGHWPVPMAALLPGVLAVGAQLLHRPEAQPAEVVTPRAPAATIPPQDRRLRVLVVDDIPMNRQVVVSMLEGRGLELVQAESGEQALKLLLTMPIDLVFLDVHMPEMDGIEVARRLRERGDHVPVVALTADSIAGTRERCLAAGMDAFVNKPAPPQELFGLVEGLAGARLN